MFQTGAEGNKWKPACWSILWSNLDCWKQENLHFKSYGVSLWCCNTSFNHKRERFTTILFQILQLFFTVFSQQVPPFPTSEWLTLLVVLIYRHEEWDWSGGWSKSNRISQSEAYKTLPDNFFSSTISHVVQYLKSGKQTKVRGVSLIFKGPTGRTVDKKHNMK